MRNIFVFAAMLLLQLKVFSVSAFLPANYDNLSRRSRSKALAASTLTTPEVKVLSSKAVSPKGGMLYRCKHASTSTKTDMTFAIFLPAVYEIGTSRDPLPALYWLSGLTCTDENFSQKASNAFAKADEEGVVLVLPDTSPRGENVPDDDEYDLGQGAGFYVDATNAPWNEHYKMYSYVTKELPDLVEQRWNVGNVKSIMGHSMGGHGALTIALKEPAGTWASVSAFAPICNPTQCPWGEKAFNNYFGSVDAAKDHDATLLVQQEAATRYDDILIDEGTEDNFAKEGQLLLKNFEEAAEKAGQKLTVRRQKGFDHSYNFMSAFMDDHIAFHAKRLRQARGAEAARKMEATTVKIEVGETAGKPIKCKAVSRRMCILCF
jgi:S-formylglutathione hydrolase